MQGVKGIDADDGQLSRVFEHRVVHGLDQRLQRGAGVVGLNFLGVQAASAGTARSRHRH